MMQRIEQCGERWYGLLLLLAVPSLVVFFPLLSGLQVIAWGDDVLHHAAYFAFWSRSIQSGDSFLWNPDNLLGYPAFATAFGFFAPWNYLIAALIHTPFVFLTVLPWLTLGIFSLGAFFVVKLLRAFGLSFWSSYLGALAYTISHQTDAFFMPVINFHLLLPLLFFTVWKLGEGLSWRYVLWGSAAVAFGWLAVNFQETFYTALVTIVFAVFVGWWQRRRDARYGWQKFLLQVLLIFAIGTGIGLIQILPSQIMAQLSTRAGGVSYTFAAEDALLPSDFIRWVIPDAKLPLGIPFGSRGASVPLYMGMIPLFFFFYGVAERHAFARFFKWVFGIVVAISIIYSPIFWLMTKLPLFSYFRVPDRWMFIAVFSATVLAAFGMERFWRGAGPEFELRLRRSFRLFGLTSGIILSGLLLLNAVLFFAESAAIGVAERFFERFLYHYYQPAGAVPLEHYFGIIVRYFSDLHQYFSLGQPIVAAAAVSLLASLFVLLFCISRRNELGRRALVILALTTVGNFVLVKGFDYSSISPRAHASPPATIEFLHAHPGRTLPFHYERFEEEELRPRYHPSREEQVIYRFAALVPNTNLFYGVESAIIKDGLEPMAISRLMSLVGAPVIGIPREFPQDPASAAKTLVERKLLLDFLGIRYIVSGYPLDEKIFPVAFRGTVTTKNIPLAIYENRQAQPLVSFVDRVQFINDADVFELFKKNGFAGVFADCKFPCIPRQALYAKGGIEVLQRRNTEVRVKTSLATPGFAVFSQNNLPGWRVFIDENEVQHHTVNTVFLGIEVPPGEHEVIFRYTHPCGTRPGFAQCVKSLLP